MKCRLLLVAVALRGASFLKLLQLCIRSVVSSLLLLLLAVVSSSHIIVTTIVVVGKVNKIVSLSNIAP